MNRSMILYPVFSVFLITISINTVVAQEILSIDFSAAQGYVDGPLVDQPAGASTVWIESNPDNPSEFFDVENEAMFILQDGGASGVKWISFPFENQTEGVLTATWDWRFDGTPDGTADVGFCISDSGNFNLDDIPVPTWNEQGGMTRMQQDDGVVDVRNGDLNGGGSYQALAELNYQDGALIHMRMEVDIDNLTIDVYAQREGEDELQLADDFLFRRITSVENNGVNSITLWETGSAEATAVIIDNIRIVGPDPVTAIDTWSLY